jgi:SAM-dependent methyltransferase
MSQPLKSRVTFPRLSTPIPDVADTTDVSDRFVQSFYEQGGDRMFDDELRTPAIDAYLRAEERAVVEVLTRHRFDHLLEVGCGYGRYRELAATLGIHYDGCDLVTSLVARAAPPAAMSWLRSFVHVGSAENLELLFESHGLDRYRTLVLFPFNCFGNLAKPPLVAGVLARLGVPAFISTYQLDDRTTRHRIEYYRACGYQRRLRAERVRAKGVVIRSDEGLRAYAYERRALADMFEAVGYGVRELTSLSEIGFGLFASPGA